MILTTTIHARYSPLSTAFFYLKIAWQTISHCLASRHTGLPANSWSFTTLLSRQKNADTATVLQQTIIFTSKKLIFARYIIFFPYGKETLTKCTPTHQNEPLCSVFQTLISRGGWLAIDWQAAATTYNRQPMADRLPRISASEKRYFVDNIISKHLIPRLFHALLEVGVKREDLFVECDPGRHVPGSECTSRDAAMGSLGALGRKTFSSNPRLTLTDKPTNWFVGKKILIPFKVMRLVKLSLTQLFHVHDSTAKIMYAIIAVATLFGN